jgi:hypothetical protein
VDEKAITRLFAQAPCWRTRALIQSASHPRSASSIDRALQAGQELGRKPIVVRFAGCESEPDRQAATIDHHMYLAG